MPVNILYCEGQSKSPDFRVLSSLLAGIGVIVPAGSKYGFGHGVQMSRNARPDSIVVAGLRDRDFDQDDAAPVNAPRAWYVENGAAWLGWYWERVEIENYLIDPVVVQKALGSKAPDADAYRTALQLSAESIADYTAARTALSLARPRFLPLSNCWGRERGRNHHPFPDNRGEADCRKAIQTIALEYSAAHRIQEQDILDRFGQLLPVCRPGGSRFGHYLTFFSGKDLLLSMESALATLGLGSPAEFLERVLSGMERSVEDTWTWLPEWSQLRKLAQNRHSNRLD